jgi:hypothetical protein
MVGTQPRRWGARYAPAVRRGRHQVSARERGAGYASGAADDRAPEHGPTPSGQGDDVEGAARVAAGGGLTGEDAAVVADATAVADAAERLARADLDALSDAGLRALASDVQRAVNRLGGLRTRCAGSLESRALRAAGPGREHQALRVTRQQLADELQLSPSEVKQAGETGRRLAESPAAAAALRDGGLPAGHAKVLADTLRSLTGADRDTAERVLLEAATGEDVRTFGRTARRLLAELDQAAAQQAEQRRHARRELRVAQTPDGMTAVHGQGAGWDGEVMQTALHAFRRPDAPGESRTSGQRSWDALVAVCRAATDAGTAAANHNVRPHVLVTLDHTTLLRDAGVVDTRWSGPLPWLEVRRHLADVGVSRLLVDPTGVPLEAGEAVRTVPAGLWKLLQVRDEVCIGHGCDVPAGWCQVMHLEVPFRLQGQLSPKTAGLGCSFHHRMLDHHGWQVTWHHGRPVLHHPDRPPPRSDGGDGDPDPPPDPDTDRPPDRARTGPSAPGRPPDPSRPPEPDPPPDPGRPGSRSTAGSRSFAGLRSSPDPDRAPDRDGLPDPGRSRDRHPEPLSRRVRPHMSDRGSTVVSEVDGATARRGSVRAVRPWPSRAPSHAPSRRP